MNRHQRRRAKVVNHSGMSVKKAKALLAAEGMDITFSDGRWPLRQRVHKEFYKQYTDALSDGEERDLPDMLKKIIVILDENISEIVDKDGNYITPFEKEHMDGIMRSMCLYHAIKEQMKKGIN